MFPPLRTLVVSLTLLSLASTAFAAPRAWKSTDGSRAIQGEFVSRDATSVTIRRSDNKPVTIPLDKLHADDSTWLNANHPLPGTDSPPANAVFDHLVFGDNRARVLEKLQASKIVESTVEKAFLGRAGLNGVFRTREKVGGLEALLFFDWDDDGGLKEITLHTTPLPDSDLDQRLIPCWKGFIELLDTLQGQPINANNQLDIATLQDGAMSATHLWKLNPSGTAMLGAAREGDLYQIAVRFTTENIKPVIISAGDVSAAQSP